ncbi:MAG: hypothetical protein U5K70_04310 [Halodesulfurarchaeum sp.]|nr:hypothetical protein [Halodesulfurarchaeum sp.]
MPWTIYPCCGHHESTRKIGAARRPVCPACGSQQRLVEGATPA